MTCHFVLHLNGARVPSVTSALRILLLRDTIQTVEEGLYSGGSELEESFKI